MKRSAIFNFLWALLLGLVMIYVFDRLDVSALSYPVCLSIVLMGLSLRQSPTLVVAISLVYILLVTYSAIYFLYHSNPYHVPLPNRVFGLVQREGVFMVVCAMAVNMSFYRRDSEQALANLEKTLSKIPVPVVISNGGGFIIFANEALKTSLAYLPADLVGRKYTDFFLPGIAEGKAMRYYIELFGPETNSVQEREIMPLGGSVPIVARLTCHGTGLKRNLITVLQPPESIHRPAFSERQNMNQAISEN